MGDRSLEEFLDDAEGGDGSPESDLDPDPDPEPSPTSERGADHTHTTYQWAPDGAGCEACGATVERRWRDGDLLVCPDCKDW
jgi:hypothetical protein